MFNSQFLYYKSIFLLIDFHLILFSYKNIWKQGGGVPNTFLKDSESKIT